MKWHSGGIIAAIVVGVVVLVFVWKTILPERQLHALLNRSEDVKLTSFSIASIGTRCECYDPDALQFLADAIRNSSRNETSKNPSLYTPYLIDLGFEYGVCRVEAFVSKDEICLRVPFEPELYEDCPGNRRITIPLDAPPELEAMLEFLTKDNDYTREWQMMIESDGSIHETRR